MRKLKDKVKKKHRRPNLPRAASQALAPRSPSQMQKSKRTEAEALTLISEKLHPDLLCDLAYMRLSPEHNSFNRERGPSAADCPAGGEL